MTQIFAYFGVEHIFWKDLSAYLKHIIESFKIFRESMQIDVFSKNDPSNFSVFNGNSTNNSDVSPDRQF